MRILGKVVYGFPETSDRPRPKHLASCITGVPDRHSAIARILRMEYMDESIPDLEDISGSRFETEAHKL